MDACVSARYFSKTMEGLLTDCDVLKQLIINRFPDVGEHDQDQWNLVSVKESHFRAAYSSSYWLGLHYSFFIPRGEKVSLSLSKVAAAQLLISDVNIYERK